MPHSTHMLREALQEEAEAAPPACTAANTQQEKFQESLNLLQAAHARSEQAHPLTVRHILTDHLGTPIALVDANGAQAGQVSWAAKYGAWGNIEEEYNPGGINQPIRFQGQQLDEETGLHYTRFRYYDPATGGYVTQDPIGLMGGINISKIPGRTRKSDRPTWSRPLAGPSKPIDIDKASGWWDKVTGIFNWKDNVEEGAKFKTASAKLSCQRAAEREKRYDEGWQNKLEDAAAVVRDGMAGEVSEGIQLGRDLTSLGKVYGYVTTKSPDCATLLSSQSETPKIDFSKMKAINKFLITLAIWALFTLGIHYYFSLIEKTQMDHLMAVLLANIIISNSFFS